MAVLAVASWFTWHVLESMALDTSILRSQAPLRARSAATARAVTTVH